MHRTSTPCSEFNDCAISGTNQASAFGTITHAAGTAIGAYCPYGKLGCDTPHGASSERERGEEDEDEAAHPCTSQP